MKHLTLIAALILTPLAATAEPADHYMMGLEASTVADIFAHCPGQSVAPDVLEVITAMLQTSPLFELGFRDGILLDRTDIETHGVGPWCRYWQQEWPHLFDPEI